MVQSRAEFADKYFMKALLIFLFLAPVAFADGLKSEDLGAQPPGPSNSGSEMSPDQIKMLLESMSVGQSQGNPYMGTQGTNEDLQKLMEEIKKLNASVEERNKMLDQLMDENP